MPEATVQASIDNDSEGCLTVCLKGKDERSLPRFSVFNGYEIG